MILLTIHYQYGDVIKWKHFPRYWPFVRGIHRSSVNSLHKGQWRRALMFSLVCAWINGWINKRVAGDLIRHRAHYDVIVMNPGLNYTYCMRGNVINLASTSEINVLPDETRNQSSLIISSLLFTSDGLGLLVLKRDNILLYLPLENEIIPYGNVSFPFIFVSNVAWRSLM